MGEQMTRWPRCRAATRFLWGRAAADSGRAGGAARASLCKSHYAIYGADHRGADAVQFRIREPYSNTDSTIRLHRPGKDGAAMSVSTPSDIPSPSMIERSPPPSKFKLMLTAILAPPGHCGSGGLAP